MDYAEMTYADLKAAAKEKGLAATGTKEELLARLEGAEPVETDLEPADEPAIVPESEPVTEKKPVTEQQVEKEWRSDIQKMKAHLEKQPKVSIMIPLEQGVPPEAADKIPFVVNLNGYRLAIKRGVFVQVPQQVAEIVQERLESEGKIGSEYRLDRNPDKQAALGG